MEGQYNDRCDIWSCGVILYILFTGLPPFNGRNEEVILERVASGRYSMSKPQFDNISEAGKDLLQKMLTFDPNERPSASWCYNHDWFKESGNLPQNKLDVNIMHGFENFYYESQLQKSLYHFLTNNLTSKEDQQKLTQTFKALDVNGNGTLSKQEIKDGYNKLFGYSRDEELDIILKQVDANGNDEVNYSGKTGLFKLLYSDFLSFSFFCF